MHANQHLLIDSYLSNLQVDLQIAGYSTCGLEWGTTDHLAPVNKFYFMCDGEAYYKISGDEFSPKPGQLFWFPEGTVQTYYTRGNHCLKKYWCHFTATIGTMNLFDVIKLPYYIEAPDSKLQELFVDLVYYYENRCITSSLKLKALLLEIISYYIEHSVIKKISMSPSDSVEKLNVVISYIDCNLSKNITLDELAQVANLHPNYFANFFKNHLGVPPIKFINSRKIDTAKKLLKTTGHNISQISELVGFDDIYHFSKVFKKYTGFSPSEYKNI